MDGGGEDVGLAGLLVAAVQPVLLRCGVSGRVGTLNREEIWSEGLGQTRVRALCLTRWQPFIRLPSLVVIMFLVQ